MLSARRYREPRTTGSDGGPIRSHWSPMPLQNEVEPGHFNASCSESQGDGNRVLMPASNAFSGLRDVIASRLAVWFASRLKCQPDDIISELSDFLRSVHKQFREDSASSDISTLQPKTPTAFRNVIGLGRDQILQCWSKELLGTNDSQSSQPIHALGHRRGFSFLPGDDSADPLSSNDYIATDNDSEPKLIRPLAWQDAELGKRDECRRSPKDESFVATAIDLRSQEQLTKSVVSSTTKLGFSRNPQHNLSGKRTITSTTSSSSRSSLLSRGSLNSNAEKHGLREDSSRPASSHLAVAAARAAKNGLTKGRIIHRQSSS